MAFSDAKQQANYVQVQKMDEAPFSWRSNS